MILPLANARDQRTQVLWGIRDFEHRFGRRPRACGCRRRPSTSDARGAGATRASRFTILAPHQARRVRAYRRAASGSDVAGGRVDPTPRVRVQRLPSGRAIAVFFYDGAVSRAVAFERLLATGRALRASGSPAASPTTAVRRSSCTSPPTARPTATTTATATWRSPTRSTRSRRSGCARLTNYGEFLERHPPTHEVRDRREHRPGAASHGVERWSEDCGCHTGATRAGTRRGARRCGRRSTGCATRSRRVRASGAAGAFRDPWEARDEYIVRSCSIRRTRHSTELLRRVGRGAPELNARVLQARRLLELQRHALLMYTSCGWFFDDPSGIETAQVIQYAGACDPARPRARRARRRDGVPAAARGRRSNDPEVGDGRRIYEANDGPLKVAPESV